MTEAIPATIRAKLDALPLHRMGGGWKAFHVADVEALILSLLQAQETPSEPSGPDVYVKVDSRGIIVGASVTLSFFDSAENIELVHGPVVLFRHISEYKRREEKPAAQETAGWQPIETAHPKQHAKYLGIVSFAHPSLEVYH